MTTVISSASPSVGYAVEPVKEDNKPAETRKMSGASLVVDVSRHISPLKTTSLPETSPLLREPAQERKTGEQMLADIQAAQPGSQHDFSRIDEANFKWTELLMMFLQFMQKAMEISNNQRGMYAKRSYDLALEGVQNSKIAVAEQFKASMSGLAFSGMMSGYGAASSMKTTGKKMLGEKTLNNDIGKLQEGVIGADKIIAQNKSEIKLLQQANKLKPELQKEIQHLEMENKQLRDKLQATDTEIANAKALGNSSHNAELRQSQLEKQVNANQSVIDEKSKVLDTLAMPDSERVIKIQRLEAENHTLTVENSQRKNELQAYEASRKQQGDEHDRALVKSNVLMQMAPAVGKTVDSIGDLNKAEYDAKAKMDGASEQVFQQMSGTTEDTLRNLKEMRNSTLSSIYNLDSQRLSAIGSGIRSL